MFTEELGIIKETEEQAEMIKKSARSEAKMMIENADTEAGKIISQAEETAKDCLDTLLSEGQQEAQKQYDETIARAEEFCVEMAADAGSKQEQVVKYIAERIVKASVNN